ncbi:unnamed protein product [Wuchereria bancrofti]|uniref:Uncharacterized protein n=1 Tax=Wuchereria bancrofti TaxID=6293 RepID=A0A3P7EZH0_WUCBA|nr:unnamed protein product [Wuchereria bancrofti]
MDEELNRRINEDRRLVISAIHGVHFHPFGSTLTTYEDIKQAHWIIHNFAEDIRRDVKNKYWNDMKQHLS